MIRIRKNKIRERNYFMGYKMTLNSRDYHIADLRNTQYVAERVDNLCDNVGFNIELANVFLDKIHLKWGKYTSPYVKSYIVSPDKGSVTSHFCLLGSCITQGNENLNVQRGECLLFKEDEGEYSYQMGTDKGTGSFFEMSMDPQVYAELFQGENELSDAVLGGKCLFAHMERDHRLYAIISEMYNCKSNYSGKLKKFYLESKAMELFLLQFSCLENRRRKEVIKLRGNDIEAIHHVRDLLENSMEHVSIPELALSAGINQTKLKYGFKKIFGKKIFEYLISVRMRKACELLKHSDMPISHIACIVGYKHAQHFTVAFRKTFGFPPSRLR